ncbi:ABC transporter ATP-binding protein [Streptomonospora nanhaiensis]|uniref:ABC transporter ATP-binding protein n=1 Tax=Streptomonospora nanhaiensis TaxID=1323731 RepID=UPI001C38D7A4|nr:ATP-binding cassette domain-containing protein [Streptomonospora nanhaiensis]MBV2363651.1 ATP-binding cassette domain-containing protein [Streptomonospora nanhaiensis]MBX9390323.1 ATP-binding cassette domain-containing protein [Streptomonospora nanhaiensis]
MIEIRQLTKRYGRTVAVDGLSFRVEPGRVTGFLGPNGAGKSTTMRMVLGLDAPTSGAALVNGRPYRSIRRPLREVGALLDAGAVDGGRSAVNHLRWLARSNGIDARRVPEVLERVGLSGAARTRVRAFSLGMRQRLGIAAALLGDPAVLLFDEPVNGLDMDGVRWIRVLMRSLAEEGRTVLLSSHLMSEMSLIADRLVVIGQGRLIADTTLSELERRFDRGTDVRSPRAAELAEALRGAGAEVAAAEGGALTVRGLEPAEIGDIASRRGLPVHEVVRRGASLEDAYLHLTGGSVEYRAAAAGVER